ncbi:serine hydroxymethyltransferase [Artemisia annua]|uniref:Serine hydroxymethyltransferase n=1 Tax=Artemisia annua TaxID=35608 RepID=A0A2U1NZV3_ARTAN|nr:serine hydroxymethyltransferase [Artemisia annua]
MLLLAVYKILNVGMSETRNAPPATTPGEATTGPQLRPHSVSIARAARAVPTRAAYPLNNSLTYGQRVGGGGGGYGTHDSGGVGGGYSQNRGGGEYQGGGGDRGAVEAEGVGTVEWEIGRALIQGNLFILLRYLAYGLILISEECCRVFRNMQAPLNTRGDGSDKYDFEEKINFVLCSALQDGPHSNHIAALAIALKQVSTPEYTAYMQQKDDTCKNFEKVCEMCHITVNKIAIFDDNGTLTPGGVRIGIFPWFQVSHKQDCIVHPVVTSLSRLPQRIAMDEFCTVNEGDSYF